MQFDAKESIRKFIEYAIQLKEYDKLYKILGSSKESTKNNVTLGRKILSVAKQLIGNAIDDFIKLLDYTNIAVAETAAEFLYPLFPNKCIAIIKNYSMSLSDDLEKHRVNTLIEALHTKQKACIGNFQKLYDCDDLSKLDREKY